MAGSQPLSTGAQINFGDLKQINYKVDVLYLIERHEEKGEKVVGVEAELARSPRAVGPPPSP